MVARALFSKSLPMPSRPRVVAQYLACCGCIGVKRAARWPRRRQVSQSASKVPGPRAVGFTGLPRSSQFPGGGLLRASSGKAKGWDPSGFSWSAPAPVGNVCRRARVPKHSLSKGCCWNLSKGDLSTPKPSTLPRAPML